MQFTAGFTNSGDYIIVMNGSDSTWGLSVFSGCLSLTSSGAVVGEVYFPEPGNYPALLGFYLYKNGEVRKYLARQEGVFRKRWSVNIDGTELLIEKKWSTINVFMNDMHAGEIRMKDLPCSIALKDEYFVDSRLVCTVLCFFTYRFYRYYIMPD